MTPREREAMRRKIDDLERARNRLPPGPDRDEASRELDNLRDEYEDRL